MAELHDLIMKCQERMNEADKAGDAEAFRNAVMERSDLRFKRSAFMQQEGI